MIDLSHIPESSGVYLMKDNKNTIIYIGKAKNLKKRVSSYFDKKIQDIKTRTLVSHIENIEIISTKNEVEAYLLESNLIKQYQPHYNIDLKDNKSYPFIAIDFNQLFPKIYKTRENHRAGVKYFGPYASVSTADSLLKIAVKYFILRFCNTKIKDNPYSENPCLYYHIGKCPGFCLGKIEKEAYGKNLNYFIEFISGKYKRLEQTLKNEMEKHAQNLEFEKAGFIRDLISNIQEMKQKQKVYLNSEENIDVVGCFEEERYIFFAVLFFREGRLLGKRTFKIENLTNKEIIIGELLSRFYQDNTLPEKIFLPYPMDNMKDTEELLSILKKTKTRIYAPATGEKLELIKMANENARIEFLIDQKMTQKELALIYLKEKLDLKVEPRRIEGYDIATIEGHWSVGACVSFFNGRPDKKNYRHFKIKTVLGQDDYAMIQETLRRRLTLTDTPLPDLFLIDGGKGQLNAALEVLVDQDIRIPIISLAKKEELIFVPHQREPIKMDLTNPSLQILTSVRDEVHRFANRLHKKIRTRRITSSNVENIKGIGPKKRILLLKHYQSLENLKKAPLEEIMRIGKISKAMAEKLIKP